LKGLVETEGALDEALIDYSHYLYDNALPKNRFDTIVSAVRDKYHILRAHKLIPGAWRALSAWGRLEPGESRRPWTPELVQAVVCLGLVSGTPELAIATYLLLHGICRPEEILEAQLINLIVPGITKSWSYTFAVLTIERPKMQGRFARVQHVLLDDPLLIHLLQA